MTLIAIILERSARISDSAVRNKISFMRQDENILADSLNRRFFTTSLL
jgi:hypothetical protein